MLTDRLAALFGWAFGRRWLARPELRRAAFALFQTRDAVFAMRNRPKLGQAFGMQALAHFRFGLFAMAALLFAMATFAISGCLLGGD